jgi:hypothetical protein
MPVRLVHFMPPTRSGTWGCGPVISAGHGQVVEPCPLEKLIRDKSTLSDPHGFWPASLITGGVVALVVAVNRLAPTGSIAFTIG